MLQFFKTFWRRLVYVFAFAFINYLNVFGQGSISPKKSVVSTAHKWAFEENRGQLKNPDGTSCPEVAWFGSQGGVSVFCSRDGKISFGFSTERSNLSNVLKSSYSGSSKSTELMEPGGIDMVYATIGMEFEGSNSNSRIIGEKTTGGELRYISGGTSINTVASNTLVYENIYRKIDLRLSVSENGLKYEFIVNPGGNPADIKIKWTGEHSPIQSLDGSISISNKLGKLTDSRPFGAQGKSLIPIQFEKKGDFFGFRVRNYNRSEALVIDPLVKWVTYFYGNNVDYINNVAISKTGMVIISGTSKSTKNLATSGAYRDTAAYPGYYDAFIAKFTPSGKRIYCTYYGGLANETESGLAIGPNNEIVIAGMTESRTGIATPGAFKDTNSAGGGYGDDAFIAKFDSSGFLVWGTYYGGSSPDGANSVSIDQYGNVYSTGYTRSSNGISSPNGLDIYYGGSANPNVSTAGGDAWIAKFSPSGKRHWATYFGGANDEIGYGITNDKDGNVIIIGYTDSKTGISTSNAYQPSLGGSSNFNPKADAFIMKLDSGGGRYWSTYYGGANPDVARDVITDAAGYIYVIGNGGSTGLASANAYDKVLKYDDAFFLKLTPYGQRSWCTYYGGTQYDEPTAITYDQKSNTLLFTGYTGSQDSLYTKDAFQKHNNGGDDAFIVKFDTACHRLWGSFFGGVAEDIPYSIASGNNFFYLGGWTDSYDLATPYSFISQSSTGKEGFLARFDTLGLCYYKKPARYFDLTACKSSIGFYGTHGDTGGNFKWTIYGGTILSNPNLDTIMVKWNDTAAGMLKVVVKDAYLCKDSTIFRVKLNDKPLAEFLFNDICQNDTFRPVTTSAGTSYRWDFGDGIRSAQKSPYHIYSQPGIYDLWLKVSNSNGCSDSVKHVLNVSEKPHVTWTIKKSSVKTYSFSISDTADLKFEWKFGDGKTDTMAITSHTYSSPGNMKIHLTVTNMNGCMQTKDTLISVGGSGINRSEVILTGVDIFPNPFTENANAIFNLEVSANVTAAVTDVLGKVLIPVLNTFMPSGKNAIILDLQKFSLKPGVYFLKINAGGYEVTEKLVYLR